VGERPDVREDLVERARPVDRVEEPGGEVRAT
jgi:hypothetical protein